jgi:hypothetical protein
MVSYTELISSSFQDRELEYQLLFGHTVVLNQGMNIENFLTLNAGYSKIYMDYVWRNNTLL